MEATDGGLVCEVEVPEVLAMGDEADLKRPCVDCGLRTGCFCDGCFASTRLPLETWIAGQRTPLCTDCDRRHGGLCHYCRGLSWATPPTRGPERPGGR